MTIQTRSEGVREERGQAVARGVLRKRDEQCLTRYHANQFKIRIKCVQLTQGIVRARNQHQTLDLLTVSFSSCIYPQASVSFRLLAYFFLLPLFVASPKTAEAHLFFMAMSSTLLRCGSWGKVVGSSRAKEEHQLARSACLRAVVRDTCKAGANKPKETTDSHNDLGLFEVTFLFLYELVLLALRYVLIRS